MDLQGEYVTYFNVPIGQPIIDGYLYWSWSDDFTLYTVGWYLDAELTTPLGSGYIPESDMTVYAKWGKRVRTIFLDANGGYFEMLGTNPEFNTIYTYAPGVSLENEDPVLPTPVNADSLKSFTGYYFDAACTQPFSGSMATIPVTGLRTDLTLYAGWSVSYQVTLVQDDTQKVEENVTSSIWNKGNTEGLTVVSNAPIDKFVAVLVDDQVVDPVYYTVREGSTIIDFTAEFLEMLGEGNHKVAIGSTDGTAESTFEIAQPEEETITEEETTAQEETATEEETTTEAAVAPQPAPQPPVSGGGTPGTGAQPAVQNVKNVPQTDDPNSPLLYVILILACGVILAGVVLRIRKQYR